MMDTVVTSCHIKPQSKSESWGHAGHSGHLNVFMPHIKPQSKSESWCHDGHSGHLNVFQTDFSRSHQQVSESVRHVYSETTNRRILTFMEISKIYSLVSK